MYIDNEYMTNHAGPQRSKCQPVSVRHKKLIHERGKSIKQKLLKMVQFTVFFICFPLDDFFWSETKTAHWKLIDKFTKYCTEIWQCNALNFLRYKKGNKRQLDIFSLLWMVIVLDHYCLLLLAVVTLFWYMIRVYKATSRNSIYQLRSVGWAEVSWVTLHIIFYNLVEGNKEMGH